MQCLINTLLAINLGKAVNHAKASIHIPYTRDVVRLVRLCCCLLACCYSCAALPHTLPRLYMYKVHNCERVRIVTAKVCA
jgi:hypothetical protein